MQLNTVVTVSLLAAVAAAQSATVEVLTVTKATVALFGFADYTSPLWASIVAAEPTATTYSLGFKDVDSSYYDDYYGYSRPNVIVTAGPSTFHYEVSTSYYRSEYYYVTGCTVTALEQGLCSVTQRSVYGSKTRSSEATNNFDQYQYRSAQQVITITGGNAAPAQTLNSVAASTTADPFTTLSSATSTSFPTLNVPAEGVGINSSSTSTTLRQSSTRSSSATPASSTVPANAAGSLDASLFGISTVCALVFGVMVGL